MEKYDPISEWLYYNKGTAVADIPDKRILVGIANVMSDEGEVDVFEVNGQEATENFTDYIEDDEKLEFYKKVLSYFTRTGAEQLSEEELERLTGLRLIIGEDVETLSDNK